MATQATPAASAAGTASPSPSGLSDASRVARADRRSRHKGRLRQVPHHVGLVLGVYATLVLLWSLSPALRALVHVPREWLDSFVIDAPDTSLSYGFVVALVAAALSTRKRVAWWIALLYTAGSAVVNVSTLVDDPGSVGSWIGLVLQVAVLALLLASRTEFDTKVRRGAGWKALGVLVTGLIVGILAGWALLEAFPGSLPRNETFLWSLNRVAGLALVDNEQFSGRPHGFLNFLLGLLAFVALAAAVVTLFRSQRASNALTGTDESALRGLIARSGHDDSLAYFATRRDKAVVFAPNGKAAITYRVEVGVCLASGDPIGLEESWPHAIEAWLEMSSRYGWAPAVMGASETGAAAFRRAGLAVLELGDEAILQTRSFSLNGPDMRPVRQAVNRARGKGVTVRIRRHRDIPEDEWPGIVERADRWRDTETERGFSMALGRLGDPLDGDCLLVEAVLDADDRVVGTLSLVPWGASGASLDLMRRDPASPNGTVELMVSELASRSDTVGITKVSLNFAVFRSVFEEGGRIGAGPVLRLWRSTLVFFSRWWQLEALYRSNLKYQPEWVPRYLCFEDNRDLPKVGTASAIAEGFLTLPGLGARTHTGTRQAVPAALLADGTLHADGSEPDDTPVDTLPGRRRPEQVRVRMSKLDRLSADGVDAYPVAHPPTHTVDAAANAPEGTTVRVSGRLLRIRDYGGVVFGLVRDWSGDLQILLDSERIDRDRLRRFTSDFDLGDLISCTGVVGRSRTGALALLVSDWRMNAKSLHPLPDKFRGLTDPEARVRQRYVDMEINPQARALMRARSAVVKSLRDTLGDRGYMEVETPILQQIHGGANAAPFLTHINAYNLDLYLRIAPELYLKRLCVGGMERVFEIGRVFRNEGADFKHNPEFTILEAYEAHSDYERAMVLCRELIQRAAVAAHGREVIYRPAEDGTMTEIDISGEWPVKTMHGAVAEKIGADVRPDTPLAELQRLCDLHDVPYQSTWDEGAVAQEMYEHLVEDFTEFPTFYTNFPTSMSPLTRPHRSIAGVAEKWDLVAWGVELGTAYSELTDPVDQRARLTAQSMLAAGGDPEAMELDEDFLQALEHGMPPTGGLGMGVDRVVMLITGGSIRETLAFPLAKPRS
ncbi:bifunctional lysylphosphatidylglycerol synthetase/lysine--tRNA ligase LysX [Rhodococcus sp. UNC23MFCrub1.1]|uniref:bifunctional lysylphosphatidylglycerol synthetase/lysine--tRNA ligase LysX n=1 Tax=Rhodococcus sp. UNC23MFCrub1.1 TaxID=1449068 RepID=UPI0009DCBF26|nr:bifunctional lysylphosphatidylglycerol synthetase/lysine--tRNA ligase LysX [Rhodococcus sp. UNC23MFCrub1.1]